VAKELEINEPELLENLQVYTKSGERVAGCGTLKNISKLGETVTTLGNTVT
jgi:hypothetical protein